MTVTSVSKLADFSSLSVASYALFDPNALNDSVALAAALRNQANMTELQATDFLGKYDVVSHQPNDAVGFSATVFREKATGKLIFSVRGTEIPSNILPDLIAADVLQISPDGYARSQATSMYRYWKQLTTVGEAAVSYSDTELLQLYAVSKGITSLLTINVSSTDFVNFRSSVLADKGIHVGQAAGTALISPSAVVDVAGHSLGGHLAMLFSRFFPANTDEVVTLNAPGFFPNSVLLTAIGIAPFNDSQITRIEAEGDGISELGFPGFWPGTKIAIAQENKPGATAAISSNHSSINGNDALALMAAFAKLDPNYANDTAALSKLIRAASNMPEDTYENALDALRAVLIGSNALTTNKTPTGNREQFYINLSALQASAEYQALAGSATLSVLANVSRDALVSKAKTDFGTFLAVRYLLPIALEGSWGVLGTIHPELRDQYNADKALTPEQRAAGQANYSEAYLADRAAMLTWKLKFNTKDIATSLTFAHEDVLMSQWQYFKDYASGQEIVLGNPPGGQTDRRQILFGSDAQLCEVLSGQDQNDRIYAGAGADILDGGQGNDYLEGNADNDNLTGGEGQDALYGGTGDDTLTGGKDNDVLYGGTGSDTYKFTAGDGWDTLTDSDGIGRIELGGTLLDGGKEKTAGSGVWYSADNKIQYALFTEGDGSQTLNLVNLDSPADRVFVKNYRADRNLGLVLENGPAAVDTTTNLIVGDTHASHKDNLDGQTTNDRLQGLTDDDRIFSGGGDDLLEGGSGSDILDGGAGKDRLYGTSQIDLTQAIQQGRTQNATGLKGDWLNGGAGDDLVVAGADNDVLLGGGGVIDLEMGNDSDARFFGDATAINMDFYREAA